MKAHRRSAGPGGIGPLRKLFGGPCARVLGLYDGRFASGDKSVDELHKFKDRAELGGAHASSWWAEVSGALNGECEGLAARIADGEANEPRLAAEATAAQAAYDASHSNEDETRLRRLERDLAHLRQERSHLTERLRRSEAQREAAYQRARGSALEFLQHYESVMRSYKAANRKSVDGVTVPEIELPAELQPAFYPGRAGSAVAGPGLATPQVS